MPKLSNCVVGVARDTGSVFVLNTCNERDEVRALMDEGYSVVYVTGAPRILVATEQASNIRTQKWRPLVSGVSIGNTLITAGTLGWFGELNGRTVALTNAHIVTPTPGKASPPLVLDVVQPGSVDGGMMPGNTVGYYHSHVRINCLQESDCPVSKALVSMLNALSRTLARKTRFGAYVESYNDVDVGLVTLKESYDPVVLMDDGSKAQPPGLFAGLLFAGTGELYVVARADRIIEHYPGLKIIGGHTSLKAGDKVVKCGRTTGCTEGEVLSADAVLRVSGYDCGDAVFQNVAVVKAKSAGGDSGSAVWVV
ncbi:MAG: hypothetical protein QW320_06615 [Ignisphaera sp.]|uniref:hypothetical protein n=1 Tax=Thermofilum sp. TaxID=1961369 RepID=UPI00316299F6